MEKTKNRKWHYRGRLSSDAKLKVKTTKGKLLARGEDVRQDDVVDYMLTNFNEAMVEKQYT